jgi:hypothetical protein
MPIGVYKQMDINAKQKFITEIITNEYAALEFSTQANFYSKLPLHVSWGDSVTLFFNESKMSCDAMCDIKSSSAHEFESGLIGPASKENEANLWTLTARFRIC